MRHRLEYAPVWLIIRTFAVLPRPLARALGIFLAHALQLLHRRLWKVGLRNLELAFPGKKLVERKRILLGVYTSLGRQLAELYTTRVGLACCPICPQAFVRANEPLARGEEGG